MKRLNFFELDIPHCANTYGVSPCTAALTGDSKCFNTPATCQDRDHLRPGYPLVDSVTETEFATDTTAHAGFLPDGIATGDLLIAIFANDGSAAITTPTNWTKKADQASGTDVRTSIFVKRADGTENATSTAGASLASDGTPFGDYLDDDPLTDAFDGTTNAALSTVPIKLAATTAYIGLTFPSGRRIHSAVIYGSNDSGFVNSINPTMTITLRGKNDSAFDSTYAVAVTEGAQIGSIAGFSDTSNESAGRTFTMTDQTTAYEHVAAFSSHNGAANIMVVAEFLLTEGHPTAAFTTASTEAAALQVFHVLKNNWTSNLDDVLVQAADAGTTDAPDPALLEPGWGNVRNLWIAAYGASSVATVDSYPDGFGNGLNSQGGSGTTGASVSSAYVVATAESIDPAPFDLAATAPGVTVGIAVRPFESISLRFASPAPFIPKEIDAYPDILTINHTPAIIGLGDNIGQRATIKVSFEDHPHSDSGPGFDKYLVDRTYDPFTQGTLWGKFRARQPFLIGSPCRLIRGLEGQELSEMPTYNFLVESTDGPGTNSIFTITAKDLLKMLDGDRAQAPEPNTGTSIGSLSTGATSVTLTPTGIGNEEYASSGWVCIGGNEVCSFTRSGDVLTIARGALGTTAATHDAGERVQTVLRYSGEDVADIITDLMINYAGVQPNYIPLTAWRTETATYLNQVYTATIPEPTSVAKLISELIEQAGLSIWATDDPFIINLQVLRPVASSADVIDETVMRADTLMITEQNEKRASEIWTYFAQRDPTKPLDETDNYANLNIRISAQAALDYDTPAIRKVMSRWIPVGGETIAERLGDLLLARYNPAPRLFTFGLFESGSTPVAPGIGYQLSHPSLQDANGARTTVPVQITSVKTEDEGVTVTAEEFTTGTPVGLTGDVITINASQDGTNLETLHDQLYPVAESGDDVICYINSGVIVGALNNGVPAFTVGNFAAGVNVYLIVAGRIAGAGGDAGDGGSDSNNGRNGEAGGTAIYTRRAINVDASLGALWGGGGGGAGGGGGGSQGGGGGGGGGGAGRQAGGKGTGGNKGTAGGARNGEGGNSGTATAGGSSGDGGDGGAGGDGGRGGNGGNPGTAGSSGVAGSGGGSAGSVGAAGNASDGNSFITYGSWDNSTSTFTPGALGSEDIRGGEIN